MLRSSLFGLGLLQAKASSECAEAREYGFRCGVIGGVHVSCGHNRCCSENSWCGDGPSWCSSQRTDFSNAYCPADHFSPAPPAPPTPTAPTFNLRALEEFSSDFHLVTFEASRSGLTTRPLPDTFPHERGSIAVHARNLQLKVDTHATFPTAFAIGNMPVGGMEIHEELHINGATGQASFHVESPAVNLCFQLDRLPEAGSFYNRIEENLHQAEQVAPRIFHENGQSITLDGQETMGLPDPDMALLFTNSSHPAFLAIRPNFQVTRLYQSLLHPSPSAELLNHLGLKFDSYSATTGNQFSVRACEIDSHSATQSLLVANPDAREFVASRIAQHQSRLQDLLEPEGLNARFNFIPLELGDLMLPVAKECSTDDLAQSPPTASSTLQIAMFGVACFVMGVAGTLTAFRKKHVTPADAYHQVSA